MGKNYDDTINSFGTVNKRYSQFPEKPLLITVKLSYSNYRPFIYNSMGLA